MAHDTLLANDVDSSRYIITRGGEVIGWVEEVRYNATDPADNGLRFVDQTVFDPTPFTLKKRPVGDYTDTNLELIFTNEV